MISQRDINNRQRQFVQKAINEQLTPPKIIQMGGGSRSGGPAAAVTLLLAEVIEMPAHSIDGVPGRAHYTLRLRTDTTVHYTDNEATEFALNALCISDVDNLMYIAILPTPEEPAANVGHEPSVSPLWWSQYEEIRVTKIWGAQNLSQLVSDAVPWIAVGEDVILIYDGTEPYILAPSLMYAGTQEEATLRVGDGVVRAVFK